ncbi:hypothetical protein PAT3040_04858 [Paenibacillus agaridevorans]|uniref:DUF1648 domain-containing protein n=1 Tax=Paenibacillus agaridevorans TaxID=171404 RepID=A0A2R5EU02_9BACL|nr:DUF5808 domain-containing protein [Paenibacillus agaridevorans]GBG10140.1 hypothetical protein PAT3040_04858 [Paenibacillus agaridevorans]
MANNWMLLLVLVIMIPVVLTTTVIPLLTRRIESFGVTIPEEGQNHPDIRALRKSYLWWNGGLGALLTASLMIITFRISSDNAWGIALAAHTVLYIIVSFGIYYKIHRAVKAIKEKEQWLKDAPQRIMVSTAFRTEKLTQPHYWFIPHLLLIMGTILVCVLGYDRFPELMPMKYDFNGEVTRSVAKSYTSVLWPVFVQAFLLIVFVFTNVVIGRSKQVAEASDPEGSLHRNLRFRRIWSAYLIIFGFMIMAAIGMIPVGMLLDWSGNVSALATILVVGLMVVSSIALSVKTGQGGSRLKSESGGKPQTTVASAADHDRHWKLGVIYFNPNDPALFVEKRFGIGWTMNMARPVVWIIVVLIILVAVGLPLIIE